MRYVLLFIAICAVIVGAVFLMGPADARTIVVDDDWSGADYDNIGEAIANAKDGDTIRVYDGTYYETNVVHVSVNLVGNGTSTVIDGYKKDHVFGFYLQADNTTVDSFYFYNWWPTHHFGGVGVASDGNLIVNNTFYHNNRGLYLGGCSGNIVLNNTFDKNYYGILVYEVSDDCTISFNTFTRSYSYGILYRYSRGVNVFSNTFENFTSGALSFFRSDEIRISFNMFDASDATFGTRTGIVLYDDSKIRVDNNTLVGLAKAITGVGTTDLGIEYNTIIDCNESLYFGRLWSGRYQLGDWCNGTVVRNNNVLDSAIYGANATYGQVTPVDARGNWWGDASGPYHPVNNSNGRGSNVSDLVTFTGWLTGMVSPIPPVAFIHMVSPSLVNEGDMVTFVGEALARNETVELVWSSSIDGELYRGPSTSVSIADLSPGTHIISLKVKDSYGKWSSEVISKLVVNGIPRATIESISPLVVNDDETVTFIGSATDPEDDIWFVQWESDIDGVLSHELSFETSSLSNGTHRITLAVSDGYGVWSDLAVGEAVVNGRPLAFIEAVEDVDTNEGDSVIFRGSCIDAEDGIIAFEWVSDIDGMLSDQMMFHTSALSNGTHVITFRAMDDFLVWSANATVTVVVNGLPRATIVSISPAMPTTGETVSFDGSWTDHEGEVLDFQWCSDIDGPLSTSEDFETTMLSQGVHTITFRVMDGHRKWSQWVWATVTVNGRPGAWIEPNDVRLVDQGEEVHLTGGFSDPEDDVRAYEWSSDIDGVVGTFHDLTSSQLSNGSHTISFRVMDGLGAWSEAATTQIVVNGLPQAILVDISPTYALQGVPVGFTGAYVDHEGDVYEFEWTSDRDGRLSDEMGFVTTYLSNGTHLISFRVMDGHGAWSDPVTGRVDVNGRPVCWIEEVAPSRAVEGQRVHFAGAAEDDLAVVAYRWTSSVDGVLSHMAVFSTRDLSPGLHEVTFQVQDDRGTWSMAASTIVEVVTHIAGVQVVDTDLPSSAYEGDQLTLVYTLENVGDVTLTGLVLTVSMDGDVTIVHTLSDPLHPGSRDSVELPWTAEAGNHSVSMTVTLDDQVMASLPSEGTLLVLPLPNDDDTPPPNDDDGGVTDGKDVPGPTFLMALMAALVALGYLRRGRARRSY